MNNILIVGAHFDDPELGAGGFAAKMSDNGKNVYKLTLTDNVTISDSLNLNVDYESSKVSSAKACEVLGINEITDFEPVECGKLTYNKEIMQKVEKVILDYNIDTTIIHFMDDKNQDHVEASRICQTAARHCNNILAYQSNMYVFSKSYYPVFFVDISEYIKHKEEALSQYEKQHNRFNRLFQANILRNQVWGYTHKVEYAEAFHPIQYKFE
ncbi:PIG-L family deacetylase [Bacillus cereus group sp. BfR-BA-01441]|uniref:PIG-L deacetylase family protein n=1 Tax=Bacillus cereus group sp. BfR-BA-01441 TaxID=2920348 RepID=UPI001F58EF85